MVPFEKKEENHQQKLYHFQREANILNKGGVKNTKQKWYHSRKGLKSPTKMVPFRTDVENRQLIGIISERGQKYQTEMISVQERVENPQLKWSHFGKT